MLNHLVLFRRKPGVEKQPERERELVEKMDALGVKIASIRYWKLSANEIQRPVCWDYSLESKFDDVAGLEAYLFHPAHVELIALLKPYFEWAAVDYTSAG
ncbi:stress protein [Achromobacter sp. DMS1]|uniref:Dabb family protein n=1 Tax=Achromobacter sp. DMS1 TaxID=1688405 RepID=UPI00069EC34A|nr:Dabb family protein [Achromobacter sp. DMS1]KOF54678.1 stress protein [Achromobacter sp. DMS1]KOF55117.1 stress protein [Achromobacter sp. DMS1]